MNKAKAKYLIKNFDEIGKTTIYTLLLLVTYLFSSPVFAQSVVGSVLCSAAGVMAFDIGRGLATLAVISLGVGAMLGRVTWGQAVTVIAGTGAAISSIVLAYAVMPLNISGTLSSALCQTQATIAQGQSSVASAAWYAISMIPLPR